MKIAAVHVIPFEPRFPEGGYVMSYASQTVLHARLVRLTTDDGKTGVGEVVRKPSYDPIEISALEDDRLPQLNGLALADLPPLLEQWRQEDIKLNGLTFALETAFLDLSSRAAGLPLSAFLGGSRMPELPGYFSLSCSDPETMAEDVRQGGLSHPVIQAKLGIGGEALDRARIQAVLDVMGPDQIMLADFNGELSADAATELLNRIRDPRIIWEEPCASLEDNIRVARELDQPVMFDQCMNSIPTFLRAIGDGAASSLVIKPAFLGGLSVARTARDMCIAAGMKMRIDGPWSGQIAAVAALHLAVGAPADLLISSANLIGPLDTPRDMIIETRSGWIMPASGPGLGPISQNLFD